MGEHQIRRIPVCDTNGRLRGIIAMADVALEAENDREIAKALEQIRALRQTARGAGRAFGHGGLLYQRMSDQSGCNLLSFLDAPPN